MVADQPSQRSTSTARTGPAGGFPGPRCSPTVADGKVVILGVRGTLSCYEAKTGKLVYDRKKLAGATAFTASPWAADGKVFCLSEDGDTFVVQAGPESKVLGKNRLDEMCMATPALVRGGLLVRTLTKLSRSFTEVSGIPGRKRTPPASVASTSAPCTSRPTGMGWPGARCQ